MPKYNELKHFNPGQISIAFIAELASQGQFKGASATRVGKQLMGGGLSGDAGNTVTFY